MKTKAIAAVGSIVLALSSGCASSGVATSSGVLSADRTSLDDVAESEAPALSARSVVLATTSDAIACMTGADAATSTRCVGIAGAAGVQPGALARVEPFAQDQVAELLTRQAHDERLTAAARTDLQAWFDRAAGAAREARTVTAGTTGRHLAAVAHEDDGHPSLDAVEDARRLDATDAATHSQLEALLAFAREHADSAVAPELEATGLLMLSQRAESAASAQPEVRDEALRALGELVARVQPDGADARDASSDRATSGATTGAHRTSGAEALAHTRSLLATRLALVAPRVTSPTLREAAQREAERDRVTAAPGR